MRKTRFILFVLAFMMFGVMNAEIASGTCGQDGDNITWVLDDDGTLTLSGSGEMRYYSSSAPWYSNREKIIKVSISEGITNIGGDAFYECSGLTSVSIPNSVTSIGRNAFAYCRGLTSMTIPNSVSYIGEYAFSGCIGLSSMTIPNSVISIGERAFVNCSGLTSVTIPNSVTSIGYYTFSGCDDVKELIYADGTKKVLRTYLTSITSVTIPNSVTSIGDSAFEDCRGLTSVTIPNSVTSIGNWTFSGCSSLTSVTFLNPFTHIGMLAFSGCIGLTSVAIPNSATSIDYGAFSGCTGLTSVTIPNSVTSIGNYAFDGCSGLTSVTIPNSVMSIGEYAFSGCNGLTSATIPNSVSYIGNFAFSGCSGLTTMTIPNSVTSIGKEIFHGCSGLVSLEVDSSNPNYCSMDNVIFNKEKTELIICAGGKTGAYYIPNSVKSIGSSAFDGCIGLTSVTIPNSVTSIGWSAFYECSSLTSVTIPNSVKSIGDYAFCGCSGLTSITIPNSVNSIGHSAFAECDSITTLYYNSNATYKFDSSVREVYYGDDITQVYPISSELSSLTKVVLGKNVGNLQSQAFMNANLKEFYITGEKNIYLGQNVFQNVDISNATLYVSKSRVDFYKATAPWFEFGKIVDLDGNEMPDKEQCANPTIAYSNGKLIYHTDTEGAEIVSEVKVDDAKISYGFEVPLSATYNITAYAKKNGYEDSEVVTATLVWIDAQLTTDAPSDVQEVKARPILVSSNGGNVTIKGLEDNEKVDVYSLSGAKLNSVKSAFGTASFSADKGSALIVKIGDRSVKVVVK